MNRELVREWLKGKKPADFDLAEAGGRLYWPDKLCRLKKDGTYVDVPVRVIVLRELEELQALKEARQQFAELDLDPKEYPAQFARMEAICRAARAIHEDKPKKGAGDEIYYPRFHTVQVLLSEKETGIATNQLVAIDERMRLYARIENPLREDDVTEEEAMALAYAIVEVRNLSPLAAFAGGSVDTCVISMASALVRSLQSNLRSPSHTP